MKRVLVLGGTQEATALTTQLAGRTGIQTTLSLAGRTDAPMQQAVPMRIGGFGGVAGLRLWLRDNRIDRVVDATHPFAAQMSVNALIACGEEGVPRLRLTRPAWKPQASDRWTDVPNLHEAVNALGPEPRRVFLPIGRRSLAPFAAAPCHFYLVRSIDAPDELSAFPHHHAVQARPPFAVEQERRLLREHRIDIIVTKNSGGSAAAAKLEAARALGLPVIMVARPPETGPVCHDIDTALAFVEADD